MLFRHLIAMTFATAAMTTTSVLADQLLYLASIQGKHVVAYHVDDATGRLSPKFEIPLPGNGGAMAFSPDAKFLYAAVTGLPEGKSGVATLRRAADGSLTLAATATITSRAPYIRADDHGRFLLAAHYGDGDVTVYRVVDGICTDELLDQRTTEKTAHCIELDPSGRFAFVPHTTPNKVYQFLLDPDSGKLLPNNPPFVAGPDSGNLDDQPRHYAHHPKLDVAYTSNERGGGITRWKFDPKQGTLTRLQTLSTLPPDYQGSSAAADIRLTPDGRFAYVSNRDVTKRAEGESYQDSLAAFSLDPRDGTMTRVGHFATVHMPRSFCIDLSGRYLYAAGQQSARLVAYRIDPQSGKLTPIATYETAGGPIWVMCGSARSE
jgi:6-phosphogluconolactonase